MPSDKSCSTPFDGPEPSAAWCCQRPVSQEIRPWGRVEAGVTLLVPTPGRGVLGTGQRLDRGECGAAGPDTGIRPAKPRILFQKARDKAGQEGRRAYLPPTGLRGKCGHTCGYTKTPCPAPVRVCRIINPPAPPLHRGWRRASKEREPEGGRSPLAGPSQRLNYPG